MTTPLWIALALLIAAGFCAWQFREAHGRRAALVMTPTSDIGALHELAGSAAGVAGKGAYSEYVEVTGTTAPGPDGPLVSPLSDTECVWYRHTITRRYRHYSTDSDGNRKTSTRTEVIKKSRSSDAFTLVDETGELLVLPATRMQGARRTVDEFREGNAKDDGTKLSLGGLSINLGSRDDTIGYDYEEWIMPIGARLFVQGQASDATGRLTIGKPGTKSAGEMVITTRSEDDMLEKASRERLMYGAGAVAAAVGSLVSLVVSFLR